MTCIKFILDKRRVKNDGTYPVKLYVCFGDKIRANTGFYSSVENWGNTGYNKKERGYQAKNKRLREILSDVESFFLDMESKGKLSSVGKEYIKKKIEAIISGKEEKEVFMDYLQEFIDKSVKENTKATYTQTRDKINSFDSGCTFETMDIRWLSRFERWLLNAGMKTNSVSIHLRNIRAVFNYAIDSGDTTAYPFRRFKIKKEETRKRALTVEELRMLRDYEGEKYIREYQDMFMLMFYLVGINSVDLFGATWDNVANGRLEYKREKTGRLYSIKIEPEAMEIINKYKGRNHILYVEDKKGYRVYNAAMSRGLKKLGEMKRAGRGGKKKRVPFFLEKPRDFDPFGQAGFAHLWLQYD